MTDDVAYCVFVITVTPQPGASPSHGGDAMARSFRTGFPALESRYLETDSADPLPERTDAGGPAKTTAMSPVQTRQRSSENQALLSARPWPGSDGHVEATAPAPAAGTEGAGETGGVTSETSGANGSRRVSKSPRKCRMPSLLRTLFSLSNILL